jgi:hypothetical protein
MIENGFVDIAMSLIAPSCFGFLALTSFIVGGDDTTIGFSTVPALIWSQLFVAHLLAAALRRGAVLLKQQCCGGGDQRVGSGPQRLSVTMPADALANVNATGYDDDDAGEARPFLVVNPAESGGESTRMRRLLWEAVKCWLRGVAVSFVFIALLVIVYVVKKNLQDNE